MSVGLYMDVHIPRAVTEGLRLRSADVLTAQEDHAARLPDPALLDRATELERLLVTQDDDLLTIAAGRQQKGESFAGVIYAHPLRMTIGQLVADLQLIALAGEPADFANRVEYLPL